MQVFVVKSKDIMYNYIQIKNDRGVFKLRADGKRVKKVDPMYTLAPYFMRNRSDSQNMITVTIPYAPIHDYVLNARRNGVRLSHLAVVIAAFVRVVSEYPQLNRFVVNSKIYARNELSVGMVVLRPGDSDPTMSKMKFDLADTVFDVNDNVNAYIEANDKSDSRNSSDRLFKILLSMPPLVRAGMAVIRWADRRGFLPKAVMDASPFHNSFTITNLASIRTNHIYHHIYDFGTTSMLVAMGNCVHTPKKERSGIVLEKELPLGVVMDERIANGSYYAKAFSRLSAILKDPSVLETPPESINVDFEFETLSKRFADKD